LQAFHREIRREERGSGVGADKRNPSDIKQTKPSQRKSVKR